MLNLSLCNNSTFKGVFWFATDKLEALHKENARKSSNVRQKRGRSGKGLMWVTQDNKGV